MGEREEFCSILFHDLNIGQMVFVQAVVVPEVQAVLEKYAKDIAELEACDDAKVFHMVTN